VTVVPYVPGISYFCTIKFMWAKTLKHLSATLFKLSSFWPHSTYILKILEERGEGGARRGYLFCFLSFFVLVQPICEHSEWICGNNIWIPEWEEREERRVQASGM
jgi:hypothetical protein